MYTPEEIEAMDGKKILLTHPMGKTVADIFIDGEAVFLDFKYPPRIFSIQEGVNAGGGIDAFPLWQLTKEEVQAIAIADMLDCDFELSVDRWVTFT